MSKYVIVVSEDALVFDDLETLRTLPTYSSIWNKCARVERVRSIYPTLTYPAHVTMLTGVYPDKHGVVDNEKLCIDQIKMPWQFDYKTSLYPDLFDAAKRHQLTTAAVFWPVTGHHPAIDYLVPECWPEQLDPVRADCFTEHGASIEVMENVILPNLPRLRFRKQPYWDSFLTECACNIIRRYRPNLLMIHAAVMDGYRHQTGVFSTKVTHGLHEVDDRLCFLLQAAENAGILEDTIFFIVSDHGQMNTTRTIRPNVLLREAGLISVADDGKLLSYTAFCKSLGMASLVYLRHPDSFEDKALVGKFLSGLCERGVYGISRVYTREEMQREEHFSGEFSFVLETDGYTEFSNDWNSPLIQNHQLENYRISRATHGYHPDKGPQPTLLAFGPGIRQGTILPNALLVDEAPTFGKALDIELSDIDGVVLKDLLLN